MLPAKKNKIDISKLTPEEQKAFRMYGKLPDRKDLISNKTKDRKYFDSGDYALSKAGKASAPVGSQHPSPENIPHSNPITKDNASPTKESSLVNDSTEGLASTPAVVAVNAEEEVSAVAVNAEEEVSAVAVNAQEESSAVEQT